MASADDKDVFLLTDYERTRVLIWDTYTGLMDNYTRYQNYYFYGKNNKMLLGGIYRYVTYFFDLVKYFFMTKKDKFQKKFVDLGFVDAEDFYHKYFFLKKNSLDFEDFILLKDVATYFMFVSGLMNIGFTKSSMSAFAKSQME